MIPCRNKPHILPGYKPADLYSSLISIRCIAVCIAVDYKKGELTAAGLINENATWFSEKLAVTAPTQLSGSVIS